VSEASVLVLGAGPTGLRAATELSASGVGVVLVEQAPVIGGQRAAWLSENADSHPALRGVVDDPRVEILTQAGLTGLRGEAGAFSASIECKPRFVTADCTRCNHCVPACPQVTANEYDAGLTFRKAIHSPLPGSWPQEYVIDIDACLNVPPNYLPCQRCVTVCDDDAIRFDETAETVEREVAAVIVATGFVTDTVEEKQLLSEFGYGSHPDVVTSNELQRLLEDPGPSGGFAVRPSDQGYPRSILLVLTRDTPEACWIMANQLRRLAAQDVEELAVLALAAPGADQALATLEKVAAEAGAGLERGSWIDLAPAEEAGLVVRYARLPDGANGVHQAELVVLSGDVYPSPALAALPALARDERGFPCEGVPGIYLAGGASGTVGVEAGAEQAVAAARSALGHVLAPPGDGAGEDTSPGWSELPEAERRAWLEDLLERLMKLGKEGRP
jgi:heterodisulfide reductase subunit A